MKKQMLLLFAMISVVAATAQFRKIPVEVTEAFKQKFPNAEKVAWKDIISSFQASFTNEGYETIAEFSSKGEWERTERILQFENLPPEVIDGFGKSKYTDWEKSEVSEIDENGKELSYRILVKKSSINKKYLYFDGKGQLKKESKTI